LYEDIIYSNPIIYVIQKVTNPKSVASSQSCKTDNLDNPRGEGNLRETSDAGEATLRCVCVCVCVCM